MKELAYIDKVTELFSDKRLTLLEVMLLVLTFFSFN